jgi:hypothetical protein
VVEVLGLLEHVLAEDAVVESAAAMELTWWKQPADGRGEVDGVTLTLAACCSSALAARS